MGKKIILEKGQKFNKLKVIGIDHTEEYKSPNGRNIKKKYYKCICECGNETVVYQGKLISGQTKSCGCLSKNHCMWNKRIYNTYRAMKKRCFLKKDKDYKNYGARGIKVCEEWKDNPKSFFDWAMSHGYRDDLTIERIDVNGNYCPENCKWITSSEQSNNRRNNIFIVVNGIKKNIKQWSEELKINSWILYQRRSRGVNIQEFIKKEIEKNG